MLFRSPSFFPDNLWHMHPGSSYVRQHLLLHPHKNYQAIQSPLLIYVDGEVSADGHNWSLGAYATDYLEKNWVTSYGGRGGEYDAEGTRNIANNKGDFIWGACKKAGVTELMVSLPMITKLIFRCWKIIFVLTIPVGIRK